MKFRVILILYGGLMTNLVMDTALNITVIL